ncbi:hypothetical protein BD769DRAFT_1690171 [Suillus cothurnatus]|nr:hypothetical protein BD769DRAFT_1690171 [Suillus cothurnatus]
MTLTRSGLKVRITNPNASLRSHPIKGLAFHHLLELRLTTISLRPATKLTGIDLTVFKGSFIGKIIESKTHKENIKPDEVPPMLACVMFCPKRAMYARANTDQGAFVSHAVWKAAFLFHIPDALTSSDVAPLMCAGATVFNAMYLYNVRPTDRVGIVGVGGLGHIAIQFAAKMGCEVVVFSGSEIPDWNLFLPVLAPNATTHPITLAEGDFTIPHLPLLSKGLTIQGSFCASRGVHVKMLTFAALHYIKPITQEFPLTVEGCDMGGPGWHLYPIRGHSEDLPVPRVPWVRVNLEMVRVTRGWGVWFAKSFWASVAFTVALERCIIYSIAGPEVRTALPSASLILTDAQDVGWEFWSSLVWPSENNLRFGVLTTRGYLRIPNFSKPSDLYPCGLWCNTCTFIICAFRTLRDSRPSHYITLRDGIYKHNRRLAGQVTTSLCLGTISTSTTQVTSRPGHYIMLRDDIYKHNTASRPGHYIMLGDDIYKHNTASRPGHYITLRDDIYKHNRDESLHSVSIPAPVYRE